MKLSAVPATRDYPHRDVKPVIKRLAATYGAERLMYGGGFGSKATPQSYRAAREHVRACIDFLGDKEQAQVLGGTAARLFYGFRS
jgi:predicted TIM-barrel fold metal-dependent hydrolase